MHLFTYYCKTIKNMIWRDLYVFKKRIKNYGINYLIIIPTLSIITFGYIQPGIYFGPDHGKASVNLLIGMFVMNMLALTFTLLVPFLYDCESDRFIDYQLLLLPPRFVLFELLLFPVILINLISLPFFPLARLVLPSYFAHLQPSWIGLLMLIFCASLFCVSYLMMGLCMLKKTTSIRHFWLRFNWPLVVLGGFWIPWHILKKYSSIMATLTLFDPFTYVTEGIRDCLIGGNTFIPFGICIMALLCFFCIFSLVTTYFFKRKLDHI